MISPVRSPISIAQKGTNSGGESEKLSFFSVKRKGVATVSVARTPVIVTIESAKTEPKEAASGTNTGNLRIANSLELLAKFRQMDKGIRVKVDESFRGTRETEEAEFKAKIETIENSPVGREKSKKSIGISYEIRENSDQIVRNSEQFRRKMKPKTADHPVRPTSIGHMAKQHSEFPSIQCKTKQEILKDIQQTLEQSYEFVQSAQSMSRELSRHFLKAPVVRPRSRALLV